VRSPVRSRRNGTRLTIANQGQPFATNNAYGPPTVRYGAGTAFTSRTVDGSGQCTNDFFGVDPYFGVVKACQVRGRWLNSLVVQVPEGQGFTPAGRTFRYGADSRWTYRPVSGTGECTSAFFGVDPAPRVAKTCNTFALAPPGA
jgi:hypothetical protein